MSGDIADKERKEAEVIDFRIARAKVRGEKLAKEAKARAKRKKSKSAKIAEALTKYGSDKGRALRDRFKAGKIDIFGEKKEEGQDDGKV